MGGINENSLSRCRENSVKTIKNINLKMYHLNFKRNRNSKMGIGILYHTKVHWINLKIVLNSLQQFLVKFHHFMETKQIFTSNRFILNPIQRIEFNRLMSHRIKWFLKNMYQIQRNFQPEEITAELNFYLAKFRKKWKLLNDSKAIK